MPCGAVRFEELIIDPGGLCESLLAFALDGLPESALRDIKTKVSVRRCGRCC